MIISGYVRCATCNRTQYHKIHMKTPTSLKLGEVREFKWKCNECGMLNFIELKASK